MQAKTTNYTLLPTQYKFAFGYDKELINKQGDVLLDVSLYQGGFGSGKTFIGSLRGLLYALKWPGCRGLVGAASQDLLDGTTKVKYLEHMENIGLKEGVHWWYTDRKNTIQFINGSSIRFKTMSDWTQFRSTEFTWIEVEEASLIDEKTFKELIARVREQKRDGWEDYFRSMFLHTNPQGARGWMYKFFHNPKTKVKGYRAVIASTRENHHLGSSYVDNLEGLYSADEIQELLEGIDVDNDSTVAFPYFTAKNIKDEIEYNKNYPLILTCDFNYNPMCWYLVQNTPEGWFVLREFTINNVTTKEMCKMVQPVIDSFKTKKLIIMGDSHGRDRKTNGSDYSVMVQHFSQLGYDITLKVQKANPRIKERLSILRAKICNAKMERRFFVDSSCERLIYNFNEAKNNLATGGLKEPTDKEIQEDINKLYLIHPIDAISYPIYYMQRVHDAGG
ncbi:MAG: phage terminase large subunit [Acetobacter sp.]|nr:phage terminase large subunit [Acetobacter sp.]